MKKVTIQASSDIALIKYWGRKDDTLRLPENGSISMIVDGLDTVTTVGFDENLTADDIALDESRDAPDVNRVIEHLNRIRSLAGVRVFAKVRSKNTFPRATGLSSSASGFAALTIAATRSLGLSLSQKELSILARQGSGSACRCVCSGYVEWKDGNVSEKSYATSLYPADYWQMCDVVAIVDEDRKSVSSSQGHIRAQTSIFFQERLRHIHSKIDDIKKALKEKDFTKLGLIAEAEALEFHTILLTSAPPLIAWHPGTLQVMHEVVKMREEGIEAYFTMNTGFNVHVLTLPENEEKVNNHLQGLPLVKKTMITKTGDAPRETQEHLF